MLRRCCAGGGGGKGDAIPGGEKLWELSLVPIFSYVSLIYNVPKHENAISRYQDMGIAWYRDIVSPRPRFGYRDSIMGVTGALDRVSVKGACCCRQRCGDEGYVFCGLVVVVLFLYFLWVGLCAAFSLWLCFRVGSLPSSSSSESSS